MKPVLDLPILIPILILAIGLGILLSWRSSQHAPKSLRQLLSALRLGSLLALCVLLLNPGKWIDNTENNARLYPIMIDDSASMSINNGEKSRSLAAQEITRNIITQAEASEIETPLFSFDENSGSPEAILVLTDGRQTVINKKSTLALQSRANNAPIYALPIGTEVQRKDIELSTTRNTITAFPNQNLQITAVIKNHHFGDQTITVDLLDSEDKIISQQELKVSEEKTTFHTFSVKAPENSTSYKLRITPLESEQLISNNECLVNTRILRTKTRVFIAEGAPYWDSKFLAQLLRQQSHMDVHSVHRLRDDRWFRIDSGQSAPSSSGDEVFPDTPEELAKYDLIIFGKNSEFFLTDKRIEALKSFVKDQGGAILFSRGKPYSGRLAALENLEPVNWSNGNTSAFNLAPTEDGQSAGLFGRALPAPDSPVWLSLPALKDAHNVDSVKPFTRILAEGSLPSNQAKFPLLMVRRYGQGATALVNADGLWKWDFYPEARELGNMYQEFWTQLIQWVVAYSEFLPGHDYSIHASNQSIKVNEPISFSLSYRGKTNATGAIKPTIEISAKGIDTISLTPASSAPVSGKPIWKSSFTPNQSGSYTAKVIPHDDSASPVINFTVNAPPTEMDDLNPDPVFLAELCESTGGKLLTIQELPTFLAEQFSNNSISKAKTETIWQSSWLQWFVPLIILGLLAIEWWLRRRNGLT